MCNSKKNNPLRTEQFTDLRDVIVKTAERYPDQTAFIRKEKESGVHTRITFAEYRQQIDALGTALTGIGLSGKKIALIGENSYFWLLAYYAVTNGVGIIVPLDKGLPPDEIENSLLQSGCSGIIYDETCAEKIEITRRRQICPLTHFISMHEFPSLLEYGAGQMQLGNDSYLKKEIQPDATCTLLFTSGTTSKAKAVELTHRNIASDVNFMFYAEPITCSDVNMAFLPFHHTFGCTGQLLFFSHGASTVFCDGLKYLQKNLKEYGVTTFFCVPLIIESMHKKIMAGMKRNGTDQKAMKMKRITKILQRVPIDIRRRVYREVIDAFGGKLRLLISGAAPIAPQIADDFNRFGIVTVQGYGLTETAPTLSVETPETIRSGSVGKALPGIEIRIDMPDEDGIGEIAVRGQNVMKGYYNQPEETKRVLRDGWFYTGDYGKLDSDGYLYITGRRKNVIVMQSGKKVYPEELEQLLYELPYVTEALVTGELRNHDLKIAAHLYCGENSTESLDYDLERLNRSLPAYKHIGTYYLHEAPFEKTSTGKIKRF